MIAKELFHPFIHAVRGMVALPDLHDPEVAAQLPSSSQHSYQSLSRVRPKSVSHDFVPVAAAIQQDIAAAHAAEGQDRMNSASAASSMPAVPVINNGRGRGRGRGGRGCGRGNRGRGRGGRGGGRARVSVLSLPNMSVRAVPSVGGRRGGRAGLMAAIHS